GTVAIPPQFGVFTPPALPTFLFPIPLYATGMAGPRCHYCDQSAEEQCPTCGRLFCKSHGEDVCLRCMAPASATPGAAVYRGSLLALVAGTAVAIYLIVSPPSSESAPANVRTFPTPTPAVVATATPTPQGEPSATESATVSATPG